MLEILLCSLLTILPDYLYRRYRQGKRFGHEITFFSVWFELRFGIVSCLMLTVALITVIFYYHPATDSATLYYRTVPILPETNGRVSEVHVEFSAPVKKGDVIFKLDSSRQQAALETARRKIAEVDAAMLAAQADILKSEGQIQQAQGDYQQALDELNVKRELQQRNPGIVPQRDIEKLQVLVAGRQGSLDAANATKQSASIRVTALLPAEKASAEAALAEAQVDLDKTTIRAGVNGRVEQFTLRVGDIVNPVMRSAGILIPDGRKIIAAGFGQIEASVIRVGMVAEATCISKPWTIIPMVVISEQDYIAAGQFRGGEQLLEAQQTRAPGTILAFLEPIYKGGLDGVTPGSSCVVNAYTSNHDLIHAKETGAIKGFLLHAVDAVGLVHALLLRIQALLPTSFSRPHRGRIARGPAAGLDQRQKTLERFVEQRRLLQIQDVTGLGKHREARCRDGVFEKQAGLDAGVVLVAEDNENRQRQLSEPGFVFIERGPPGLKAALGMGRSLRIMARQRGHEFGKSTRVLGLEADPVRRLSVDFGGLRRSLRLENARVLLVAFAERLDALRLRTGADAGQRQRQRALGPDQPNLQRRVGPHREADEMGCFDVEMVEHGEYIVAEMLPGEGVRRRGLGRFVSARRKSDAAVTPRQVPHLRLPAGIIGGELVNEQDRGAASGFFIVKPRLVLCAGVRHCDLPCAGVVARRSPIRRLLALPGKLRYPADENKKMD